MTSKVIEGHKSSSNFSVNQTSLIGWSVDASPSISFSLHLSFSYFLSLSPPFALAKNNLHTTKFFRYAVSLYVTYFCVRLYSGIRLSCKAFLWYFLSGRCWRFILPFGRFYEELKEKSSLSLYLLPFTLSLSLYIPYISLSYLSLSPSIFLSPSPSLSLFSLYFSLVLTLTYVLMDNFLSLFYKYLHLLNISIHNFFIKIITYMCYKEKA